MMMAVDPQSVRLKQRVAKNKASINGVSLLPAEKAIAFGRRVIEWRAAQTVDAIYNLAGATAIYEDHPLQRYFQDAHVITQHLQGRLSHYELVGRHWLGLPIDQTRL